MRPDVKLNTKSWPKNDIDRYVWLFSNIGSLKAADMSTFFNNSKLFEVCYTEHKVPKDVFNLSQMCFRIRH